jgi:cytochrome b561/polyisoprenoid-binding protein YceI
MPSPGARPPAYHGAVIALHWAIAALIAFQLCLGWSMTAGSDSDYSAYQVHKSIGIIVLLLALARLSLAVLIPRPAPVGTGMTVKLAIAVHIALYIFMIGAPLSGWALVSTSAIWVPTLLFGLVPWPHLPLPRAMSAAAIWSHAAIGWAGAGLIALHVAGALRHQFLLRDDLLARMAPLRRPAIAAALASVSLVAAWAGNKLPGDAPPPTTVAAAEPVKAATPANAAPDPQPATAAAISTQAPAEPVTPAPVGAPPEWDVLPGGSIGFTVGMEGGSVGGRFERWSASIRMDPDRPENARLRADIAISSLVMDDGSLRDMALGADYLAGASHPDARFEATDVTRIGGNRYIARGHLQMRGIRHPQTLTFTLQGEGRERTVTGTADIRRADFGVGAGDAGASLAPTVRIELNFRARQKP